MSGVALVPDPPATARLLIAGDTHGNLDWLGSLCKTAAKYGCAGVVQLGDFGLWPDQKIWRSELRSVINDRWLDAVAAVAERHGVWLRFIDGNHDAHPLARAAYPADRNGVRPIRDGRLDWADRGSVWEWAGVRFGALGGAASVDKEHRAEGRSWWPTEEISNVELAALIDRAGLGGVDVLLTHDAPQMPPGKRELADIDLAAKCRRSNRMIQQAVDAVRPKLLLHGHWHMDYWHMVERPWGAYKIVGLSSDQEAYDFHGGPWCVLGLPSLAILRRKDL